ncbi:hypothetical protein J4N45_13305 [Vibrio sp. SCSIO 43140]|uniref:hypothetical protein n=1 Tax=Vibrio sp. SCSIO 43140 TaxID=2819100 RepID=UPI0020764B27|nr:hypothetical protein [Vibrio sp. SCSIO 43140]USD59491.1 hypothetical protein J4N45_13305 [Vibrio sp. SCSIO 43140]
MSSNSYLQMDVPFNSRYICWFCGEPSIGYVDFPQSAESVSKLEHSPIAIPMCDECSKVNYHSDVHSIWALRDLVKHSLITKYAKHLGIGENWIEQELKESEFSGSVLGGFGQSAWEMYEIAKSRVAFKGWNVSIDEVPFEGYDDTSGFSYDGVRFLSLNTCIDYYVKATSIDRELMVRLIDILTTERFGYALRIALLNKNISHLERDEILNEISTQEYEQKEVEYLTAEASSNTSSLEDVAISGTIAPAFAIQWAISKKIKDLDDLCSFEDNYFDDFEHLGGPAAFSSYNGLQLYLEAREDPNWIASNDPNKAAWSD